MSVKPASANHPRMFYGWLVVAGAFTVTFVGFGCVCFAFDASGSYYAADPGQHRRQCNRGGHHRPLGREDDQIRPDRRTKKKRVIPLR